MAGRTQLSPSKARKEALKLLAIRAYSLGKTLIQTVDYIKEVEGWTLSPGYVSKLVKAAMLDYKAETIATLEDHKYKQLAKIDALEETYLAAWEKSDKEKNPGNKKWLDGLQWCIDKRFEVLGGLAPQQIEANIAGTVTNNTTIRRVVFKGREQVGTPEVHVEKEE
jgi:hypothetical protein